MTPVEELFERLWNTDKDKLTWHAILKDALQKEENEFKNKYEAGFIDGLSDGC